MDEQLERIDRVNEQITIKQRRGGLTFGTDAYLLYAYMRPQKNARAVELGAGTGIISLLAAAKGKLGIVYDVEIQKTFADIIAENAGLNNLTDKVIPVCSDLRMLTADDVGGLCDCVFTNPPYMRKEGGFHNINDEKNIARREICGTITDFCAAAKRVLKFGGTFYAVYRPDRLADLIGAMRESAIEPKRLTLVIADYRSQPSLVLCEGRYGGAPGLFVTKPLVMHKDASADKLENTDEMNRIYEKGEFDDVFIRP